MNGRNLVEWHPPFIFLIIVKLLLHWDTSVLLGREVLALGSELCESTADAETSIAWLDYVIDVAVLCSLVRISEEF